MLRQLLALLALIAGLTALPASAEVRLSAQSRHVELASSEAAIARPGVAVGVSSPASSAVSQVEISPDHAVVLAADLPAPVRIGIDRAHE